MKYFAYGMNTNLDSMSLRCPTAVCLGVAAVDDHRLVFRCHADIEAAPGEQVWGVLWDITPADLAALDRLEGFPEYYVRKHIMVRQGQRRVSALVYYMTDQTYQQEPSAGYLAMVTEGYEQHGVTLLQLNTVET